MGKRNTEPLPEAVEHLRMEVQEWRRTKTGPGAAMPHELWETAVRLARAFGVCRIAGSVRFFVCGPVSLG